MTVSQQMSPIKVYFGSSIVIDSKTTHLHFVLPHFADIPVSHWTWNNTGLHRNLSTVLALNVRSVESRA